jgi:LacI family transcriptional regulator
MILLTIIPERNNWKAFICHMKRVDNKNLAARVADLAGVSVMTVSRVFTKSSSVREETRRRVLNAAGELGYHPNAAARALRTGRFDTVGFIVASPYGLSGDFHSSTFSAFESELTARGLAVFLSIAAPGVSLADRVRQQILAHRCGVLVVRFDQIDRSELVGLAGLGVPIVAANYMPEPESEELGFSTIGFDNHHSIAMAVRHLASLGHRRIAHLRGTPGWLDTVSRGCGFVDAMAEVGLEVKSDWTRSCDFSRAYQTGIDEMSSIFSQHLVAPTAVVCDSDEIAAGAMAAARRWGKVVPEDFSVVGFDDAPWGAMLTPPLTSISHSGADLGKVLGETVIRLFEAADTPASHLVLNTRLVIRESTAPAPEH